VHLSAALALERIMLAQDEGQAVWTETCPQYMLLDDDAMERWGPYAKIGPPLRSPDRVNQEAMWRGSEQGSIACVASDHAPFSKDEKEAGWRNIFCDPEGKTIPFGAPSVETMVPLMFSEGVVKRGLPVSWMARVLAENPARVFGLYPRKGAIQPGADADLLIIDPKRERTIHAADQHVTAGYTLYEDWTLTGLPVISLSRGRILLNDGKIEAQPGSGKYLPRRGPSAPL
jgi:dihydropyrimidinase